MAAALSSAMSSLSVTGFSESSIFSSPLSIPQVSTSKVPCSHGPLTVNMAIKRWKRQECKPNSLPVLKKLHVKVGDTVQVIAGADKGKVTEVTRTYYHNAKVLCRDVNLKTKHVKGRGEGESGQIIQVEAPIHSSNVMLYSKDQKVRSRVGHKILDDGTHVRFLLKTGEVIDKPGEWKRREKKSKPQGGEEKST